MQHHDSSVYLKNYMPNYIGKDLQAIFRGLPPQAELMRAASGMSRSIDQRRPRALNPSQLAQVRQHPEVKLLRRRKESLEKNMRACGARWRADGTDAWQSYREICRQLQSKEKKVNRAMLAAIRAAYGEEQPVADIENQLRGRSEQEEGQGEPEVTQRKLCTTRERAFNALFTIATSDPADESKRRAEAINAVTALCQGEDSSEESVSRSRHTHTVGEGVNGHDEVADTKPKPISIPIECLPTQCIFCLGNGDISLEERTHAFGARGDLKRHFKRKHLRHIPEGEPIDCPYPECDAKLEHKQHLQSHAATVHKTIT